MTPPLPRLKSRLGSRPWLPFAFTWPRVLVVAVTMLAVTTLTGCGRSSDDPETTPPPSPAPVVNDTDTGVEFAGLRLPAGLEPVTDPYTADAPAARVVSSVWRTEAAAETVLDKVASRNSDWSWTRTDSRLHGHQKNSEGTRQLTVDVVWSRQAKETLVRILDTRVQPLPTNTQNKPGSEPDSQEETGSNGPDSGPDSEPDASD